ncbi:sensor histidine kinase [Streptomyces hiroshimensis]|uniref:histidine kinase n=1 Tax=Streptomyces hiroshimensis TaxID=66424 RepID=A0ABQ2Z6T5_9ACTN|nr:histidine kinase [Streptomyces hiroshimensis]GGY06956.1 two-component sensor histidine kinase [Streptomyces hiroshimensis]
MSAAAEPTGILRRAQRARQALARFRPPGPLVEGAVLALACSDLVTLLGSRIEHPAVVGLSLLALAALPWRRRRPLTVLLLTLPALTVGGMWLAAMIALVRVAVVASEVTAALSGLCVSAAVLLDWTLFGGPFPETGNWLRAEVYCALVGAGPVVLGRLLRSRRRIAEQLLELARCRDRERAAEHKAVAARERAALAREMHDVVGHEMSLIAVRAAALAQGSADPAVRKEADLIRELSVRALDEVRHTVGVLRSPRAEEDATPSVRRLADIAALAERSGLPVRAVVEPGTGVRWPAAVELAAYRTVQEALTNVRRHGDPARPVEVRVESVDDHTCLVVEVRSGRKPAAAEAAGGHGLAGLRERARLLGGDLAAGPVPGDAYLVRAAFPAPGHALVGSAGAA